MYDRWNTQPVKTRIRDNGNIYVIARVNGAFHSEPMCHTNLVESKKEMQRLIRENPNTQFALFSMVLTAWVGTEFYRDVPQEEDIPF